MNLETFCLKIILIRLTQIKWNVPADPIVEPAVSATKVIKEVEPVSIQKVTKYDKSKPYAADGQLYLPGEQVAKRLIRTNSKLLMEIIPSKQK